MKERYGITGTRPLADFLPTLTIAATNLATEMTNHNVQQSDIHGEVPISNEHIQNNKSVREMLGQRGIKPEALPPEEDIAKLERKEKSEEKMLGKKSGEVAPLGERISTFRYRGARISALTLAYVTAVFDR